MFEKVNPSKLDADGEQARRKIIVSANKRGKHCPEYETMGDKCWCVAHPEIEGKKLKCSGNRHNCVKVDYQKQAILKEL
jgi:hypothetical protein